MLYYIYIYTIFLNILKLFTIYIYHTALSSFDLYNGLLSSSKFLSINGITEPGSTNKSYAFNESLFNTKSNTFFFINSLLKYLEFTNRDIYNANFLFIFTKFTGAYIKFYNIS